MLFGLCQAILLVIDSLLLLSLTNNDFQLLLLSFHGINMRALSQLVSMIVFL